MTTPWNGKLVTGIGGWLFRDDGEPFIAPLTDANSPTLEATEQQKEQMRQIALRWNCHDELVAVVKKLLRRLEAKDGILVAYRLGGQRVPEKHLTECDKTEGVEVLARQAIARAEGR